MIRIILFEGGADFGQLTSSRHRARVCDRADKNRCRISNSISTIPQFSWWYLIITSCFFRSSDFDFWWTDITKLESFSCRKVGLYSRDTWMNIENWILLHSGNPSLDLSLCGTPIEEAKDVKLLGVKIDKHLNWDNHIDFLIDKLNSRICLLRELKHILIIG